MPASITHLIIQQKLKSAPGLQPQYSALLNGNDTNPYSNFGSIGPDFLFFSVGEYSNPGVDQFLGYVFQAYDALEPFIAFKDQIADTINSTVVAPLQSAAHTIDQNVFQGIFASLSNTSTLLNAALMATLEKIAVQHIDFFYPFYPKIQLGCPEKDWFWFDFLHYRRTGKFCSNMWAIANAQNNANLKRYCLGYASHIGSDVVGHSYVNAVVGGPYRNHWRRHKLVENWIDAYAKDHYPENPAIVPLLSADTDDETYVPNAIAGSNYYRLTDFKDANGITRLPADLKNMFIEALKMTYAGIDHPRMLDGPNLELAYLAFQKWFHRTTTLGKATEPTPVLPPWNGAAALLQNYIAGFPAYPGGGGGGVPGPFSLNNLVQHMHSFLQWLGAVASYTFNWITSNAAAILALPVQAAIDLIKWLLYQIQKGAFEIYDNARFLLVLCGYLYPEPKDLLHPQFGKAFISTSFVGLTQGGPFDYNKYPHKQVVPILNCPPGPALFTNATQTGNEYHLKYPASVVETPLTRPTPLPFTNPGVMPEKFIGQNYALPAEIAAFASFNAPNIGPYAPPAPPPTHTILSTAPGTPDVGLGSALDFSRNLINAGMQAIPNFNLDSDRGYGWKSWAPDSNPGGTTLADNNPLAAHYLVP